MRQYTKFFGIVLGFLLASPIALAADVSVTEDITFQTGNSSYVFTLQAGSSFDTLTINDASISFALPVGASLSLLSHGRFLMSNNQNLETNCDGVQGLLTVPAQTSSTTLNITPTGTACTSGGGGSSTGGSSAGTSFGTPVSVITPSAEEVPVSGVAQTTYTSRISDSERQTLQQRSDAILEEAGKSTTQVQTALARVMDALVDTSEDFTVKTALTVPVVTTNEKIARNALAKALQLPALLDAYWISPQAMPSVKRLLTLGILETNTTNVGERLNPHKTVTRAELARMAVLVSGVTLLEGSPDFVDVDPEDSDAGFVATAVRENLLRSFAGNSFRPRQGVTRWMALQTLFNAKGLSVPTSKALDALMQEQNVPVFYDIPKNTVQYRVVHYARSLGIIPGSGRFFYASLGMTRESFGFFGDQFLDL